MRRISVELLQAEAAAERKQPPLEDAFQLISPREYGGLQYTLMADDLLIRNGRFANRLVSDLVKTVEGRDYVGILWRQANAEMRHVICRFFSE